ncbi:hypothetical protein HGA11_22000 [Mycolicibacterium septicum DSM 44393]|uniref:Uncharacterized protein n=1 Tax=Mycolicibacterium septicum DSM 44393 TaxID=1341646 RepID=A0A7X6MSS5_9MYCO|nr:hypothetical protein [Mycolicibacterium septicum]NKZ13654.1 hypothetical protein [Mycolicibacterium septicum DSM 44393]
MDGWYYTPGWGALGTITVAVIAVLFNLRSNRRTLRLSGEQFTKSQSHAQAVLDTSIAQFERVREEARLDKLRIEIIGLINALAERTVKLDKAIGQIDEVVEGIARAEEDLDYRFDRVDKAMRAIMAAEYWGVYNQISGHAFAIRLLTKDEELLALLNQLQPIIAEERTHYEGVVMVRQLRRRREDERLRASLLDDEVRRLTKQLTSYALVNLRNHTTSE